MDLMECLQIKDDTYTVSYDPSSELVIFKGSLRLNGTEDYVPIETMLHTMVDKEPSSVTLDLRQLDYLNSSGVNMLSKFVIRLRHQTKIQLVLHGSEASFWQKKTLKNMQRLMPGLRLEMV